MKNLLLCIAIFAFACEGQRIHPDSGKYIVRSSLSWNGSGLSVELQCNTKLMAGGGCSGIESWKRQSTDKLEVIFGAVTHNKGPVACTADVGPARTSITFDGLHDGVYQLEFVKDLRSDKGTLVIDGGKASLHFDSQNVIEVWAR